jgi:hypothetical protein
VSGFGGRERRKSPYLPYAVSDTSFAHASSYERCKATLRCPRAKEVYNVSDGTKRISYQAYDGGRHFELSSNKFLFDDRSWAEAYGDADAMQARLEAEEVSYTCIYTVHPFFFSFCAGFAVFEV